MQLFLDPLTNVYYSSFYIQGLIELFGKECLHFLSGPFYQLKQRACNFNFVIVDEDRTIKVSIDFGDVDSLNQECYQWCDVYGKVNTNWSVSPPLTYPKLVSLAPDFGIRVWNFRETIYYALSNVIKSGNWRNARKFFGKYKRQYALRLPIGYYQPESYHSDQAYIYHISTLWYSDEWNQNDQGVNRVRANFIRACKAIEPVRFEGGLIFQDKNRSSKSLFADVLCDHEVGIKEYLAKTKQSWLVFNTPAFWNCHGWKLGEYLSLGKAIISTPLSNDLPSPLIHGQHIHFIQNDSEEKIREAVELLIQDHTYRHKLERGARRYWEQYGTPFQAIKLLGL